MYKSYGRQKTYFSFGCWFNGLQFLPDDCDFRWAELDRDDEWTLAGGSCPCERQHTRHNQIECRTLFLEFQTTGPSKRGRLAQSRQFHGGFLHDFQSCWIRFAPGRHRWSYFVGLVLEFFKKNLIVSISATRAHLMWALLKNCNWQI